MQWFQQLIDVTYMKIGWFLVELLMFSVWVAFLVGALHGVGLCPVKTSKCSPNYSTGSVLRTT